MSKRTIEEVLKEHFELEGASLRHCIQRMAEAHEWSKPFLYDASTDFAWLDRLDRAMTEFQSACDAPRSPAANDTLVRRLHQGEHVSGPMDERGFGNIIEISIGDKAREYHDRFGRPAFKAFAGLEQYLPQLRKAIAATRNEINSSKKRRRTLSKLNLEEAQVVAAAKYVWEIAKGKPQPLSSLNEYGPFGCFLADLFEVFGLDGNTKSAVRLWKKEIKKESEH